MNRKGGDVKDVQKEDVSSSFEEKFSERRTGKKAQSASPYCARWIQDVMGKTRVLFHWPARRRRPFIYVR